MGLCLLAGACWPWKAAQVLYSPQPRSRNEEATKPDRGALRRRATERGASTLSARTLARPALTRARCAADARTTCPGHELRAGLLDAGLALNEARPLGRAVLMV